MADTQLQLNFTRIVWYWGGSRVQAFKNLPHTSAFYHRSILLNDIGILWIGIRISGNCIYASKVHFYYFKLLMSSCYPAITYHFRRKKSDNYLNLLSILARDPDSESSPWPRLTLQILRKDFKKQDSTALLN